MPSSIFSPLYWFVDSVDDLLEENSARIFDKVLSIFKARVYNTKYIKKRGKKELLKCGTGKEISGKCCCCF